MIGNEIAEKITSVSKKPNNNNNNNEDAEITASKRAIQKTAEASGDMVGNNIADKITSFSKKSTKKLPTIDEAEELTTQKRYISPEERQQIIDEVRLVPRNY